VQGRVLVMREQRVNSRIQTRMRCELCVEQITYTGRLLSISMSGALISSCCKPDLGSPATMTLELLEPARKISLAGHVVRVKRGSFLYDQVHHVAIRFNAITPDGILLLKAATENKNTVSLPV